MSFLPDHVTYLDAPARVLGQTSKFRRDASNQCPTSQPHPQPFIFYPRFHIPFPFTAKSPYSSQPQSLQPKTHESPNLRRPTSHCKHGVPSRKPLALRSIGRSWPHASRASVWTTSLLGMDFTVYRIIQVSLRIFFISPFALDHPLSILQFPLVL